MTFRSSCFCSSVYILLDKFIFFLSMSSILTIGKVGVERGTSCRQTLEPRLRESGASVSSSTSWDSEASARKYTVETIYHFAHCSPLLTTSPISDLEAIGPYLTTIACLLAGFFLNMKNTHIVFFQGYRFYSYKHHGLRY